MFSKKRVYLDTAAGMLGNPSSPHTEGRAVKNKLEDARRDIARLVECKADDILFTSGATEANALAILGCGGFVNPHLKWGFTKPPHKPHVLYLPSAHASIVENVKLLAERGVEIEPLPIANGQVDIEQLKTMLRPQTMLVTMEAVCGETGTIWNTREVAIVLQRFAATPSARSARAARPILHLANGVAAPLLHVDASQAAMTEKISRSHFGADLLTLDGGKLGVRGVGCLIAHRTIPLSSLYGGGGQERGVRSGTENVEAVVAFAAALTRAVAHRDAFSARAVELRARLLAQLDVIPGLLINTGRVVAPHIVNLSLPGRDTDYLVALLDTAGFAVSTKSACESASGEGSRAVLALSGDPARAAATLRVSFGPSTTKSEIDRFVTALLASVHFVDSTARG